MPRAPYPCLGWIHAWTSVLFCGSLILGSPTLATSIVGGIHGDPTVGVRVQVSSLYDTLPPYGFVPTQIEIENNSGKKRSWSFTFDRAGTYSQAGHTYHWNVSLENGAHRVYDLMVPIGGSTKASDYVQILIRASGYGLLGMTGYYSTSSVYTGKPKTGPLAMSSSLAAENMGLLQSALDSRSNELYAAQFDPTELPADWRALLGFQSLWITESDWIDFQVGTRDAVLLWVEQGGHLVMAAEGEAPSVDIGVQSVDVDNHSLIGLGRLIRTTLHDNRLNIDRTCDEIIKGIRHTRTDYFGSTYRGTWALADDRDVALHSVWLVLFLFGFAIVVGPVNLIWLAGKQVRWRMFVTTPVIAIGASLFMIAMILLQDGIGGAGERVVFNLLVPEKRQMLVVQEQASCSGVLLSRRFELSDQHFLTAIPTDRHNTGQGKTYERTRTSCAGDWFSSRAVQAHYVLTYEPTRARLEQVGVGEKGTPVILSSFERALHDVYLLDHQGRWWFARHVPQGRETDMEKSHNSEFVRTWWAEHITRSGIRVDQQLAGLRSRRGYFFAVGSNHKTNFVDTHPSIQWKNRTQVIVGPYQKME